MARYPTRWRIRFSERQSADGGVCSAAFARNYRQTNNYRLSMKKILLLTLAISAAALLSAAAGDAKELYDKGCAKCHGKEGKGDTKMGQKLGAKDYTDAKVQAELTDDAAIKAIKEGLKDKEGKVLMKPAEDLSDADIKALVAYMRTFKK
jgi:mono/diheme cytochrome c family protein